MKRLRDTYERGFTLIELVITMLLLGILATVGSNMVVFNLQSARIVDSNQATNNQARYLLERITRELREIKLDTSTSLYGIASPLTKNINNISFTRTIGTSDTSVTIALDPTSHSLNLTYATTTPAASTTSTLASNATAFTLNFYDIDGNDPSTASPPTTTSVRFVEVSVTLTDPTNGKAITERMKVALRNT